MPRESRVIRRAAAGTAPWRSKLRRIQRLKMWAAAVRALDMKRDRTEDVEGADLSLCEMTPQIKRACRPNEAEQELATRNEEVIFISVPEPVDKNARCSEAEGHSSVFRANTGTEASTLALALGCKPTQGSTSSTSRSSPRPPVDPAFSSQSGSELRLDAATEIARIARATTAREVLNLEGLGPRPTEEQTSRAWKRLVLLLHPDKLHNLDAATRVAGVEALHQVHTAREELKLNEQKMCAETPTRPSSASAPRCTFGVAGKRKMEISWSLPHTQDKDRPVENYEVWGPRYFSDDGEAYDLVLLATLPPLQSQFVLVEEAPTQQDVMWAADRVRRPTLPISVYATNGRGQSEVLTFELPWGTAFPWLRGTPTVLCHQCLRLNPRRGEHNKCMGCAGDITADQTIIVRCPDCHGEALWAQGDSVLHCTCCMRRLASSNAPPQVHAWRPSSGNKKPAREQTAQHWGSGQAAQNHCGRQTSRGACARNGGGGRHGRQRR